MPIEEYNEVQAGSVSVLLNLKATVGHATVCPAEYWDELKMRGNVRTGSLANLIVWNEDPLDDIRNTLTIDKIIGDFFNPTVLLKFSGQF